MREKGERLRGWGWKAVMVSMGSVRARGVMGRCASIVLVCVVELSGRAAADDLPMSSGSGMRRCGCLGERCGERARAVWCSGRGGSVAGAGEEGRCAAVMAAGGEYSYSLRMLSPWASRAWLGRGRGEEQQLVRAVEAVATQARFQRRTTGARLLAGARQAGRLQQAGGAGSGAARAGVQCTAERGSLKREREAAVGLDDRGCRYGFWGCRESRRGARLPAASQQRRAWGKTLYGQRRRPVAGRPINLVHAGRTGRFPLLLARPRSCWRRARPLPSSALRR